MEAGDAGDDGVNGHRESAEREERDGEPLDGGVSVEARYEISLLAIIPGGPMSPSPHLEIGQWRSGQRLRHQHRLTSDRWSRWADDQGSADGEPTGRPGRMPLSIAAAQPRIAAGVAENALVHAEVVRAAGARVVVFPELSLTGYELDGEPVVPNDARLGPLVSACATSNAVALVGAPVREEDGRHIAVLRVDALGAEVVYRKMTLGGAEPQHFTAGTGPSVVEIDGWRLGLGICKDVKTSSQIQATAALGIDAYVAGVVHLPEELPGQDDAGLAITRTTGTYVAFASCADRTDDGFAATAGHSTIWAPDGGVLARAGRDAGAAATAVLR